MTLRLTVHRQAWLQHVHATATAYGPALVPVVKGNGYGFGRPLLHDLAATFGDTVCVGTVHELADVPPGLQPVVLTPALGPELQGPLARHDAVLTIDQPTQVDWLTGGQGRVMVKLGSSMRRYGVRPDALRPLLDAAARHDVEAVGYALHLPLAGSDEERAAEVTAWLPHLPGDGLPLWVSHLQPDTLARLAASHPDRPLRARVGTALWHGTPRGDFLHLGAVVLHTEPITAGQTAGYRHTPSPVSGTLVAVGAGSAHGVALLEHDDPVRRSPFHFGRQRMIPLERPHMHTTMCVVPDGQPCPEVGELVDVQQPLINVRPDEIAWRP